MTLRYEGWTIPRITTVNPAFTFLLLGLLPVFSSIGAAPFGKNLLIRQNNVIQKLHINRLFCQLIVLTLQCCCVYLC